MRDEEQSKFHPKCALMIFVHYATQHPLYTYAVYSPRTKRVLFRQDCIFLTNLFPMRTARTKNGLGIEGDVIIPYRSPSSIQVADDPMLSFHDWNDNDPLPEFQDHVSGYTLNRHVEGQVETTPPYPDDAAFVYPDNPAFGPPSVVKTSRVPKARQQGGSAVSDKGCDDNQGMDDVNDTLLEPTRVNPKRNPKVNGPPVESSTRRPIKQRWYYEPVLKETMLVANAVPIETSSKDEEEKESRASTTILRTKILGQ